MDVGATLKDFIRTQFLAKSNLPEIGVEDSLLDSGLIDSTGIFELVSFIESTFSIEVPDEEIVPENFETIRDIAAFVTRRVAAKAQGRLAG